MTVTLQIGNQSRLISTVQNKSIKHTWIMRQREEKKLAKVHRKVANLKNMRFRERKKIEKDLIEKGHCPGCGSSLNDIANHLEGKPLNYKCTYCI